VKLGVFGGTFDPPHNGHLALARAALDQLELERVIWVPAGDPWRKAESPVSPARHRLAMVRLALQGQADFEVTTIELDRPGPTYTLDTLLELKRSEPEAQLVFLAGTDALEDLPHWHEPARIVENCLIGATSREGVRPGEATLEAWLPGLSARVRWFDMPRVDVSATAVRRRVAAGESVSGLVPTAVEEYITRNKLYSVS
jgi:nicotinate-nucleotide adenylyltransferase